MGKDLKGKELGVGFYQRKNGLYEAKAKIDGKIICLYSTDLKKLREEFKEAKENVQTTLAAKYSKLTLNEWFEEWFDTYKAPYIKDTSVYPMKSKYNNTFGRLIGEDRKSVV